MPNPNTKGISVHVDRELHAEITAYLQENNMKMGDFIALAAQNLLRPPSMALDPELQSEIDAYLEDHDMAMDEFIAMVAEDKLHPKTPEVEVKTVGNTRTLAFQVPEELFQRIKDYLKRNGMTQRAFVIGLIEEELERDEELLRKQQEDVQPDKEEQQDEGLSEDGEAPVGEDFPEEGYEDKPGEGPAVDDSEGSFEPGDEEDYEEIEDMEFPEETEQDTPAPGYIEGKLGAAFELAPNFDYGQDESFGFPEPDDEEETEEYGMNMAM